MQLKSIEIVGFKSFPERTKIDFHDGMTAIVGPNGSGKSNVTDAIRWVLGEQNAKVLRGKKMEDMIFSGTQNRRQMGYAEVSLVFDNHDKTLDLPYDEVKFSRRLYRSGESEYAINQQNCRLKDVQKMILDTGIGRSGYAVVGQGRVDEILSPRSEDRRQVFDEASGISKFRVQRDESQKKLEDAMLNLSRTQDIMDEMSLQLEPLKEQAEIAKQFLALQSEKRDIEQAFLLKQIEHLEELHVSEKEKTKEVLQKEALLKQDLQLLLEQLEKENASLEAWKKEEESSQEQRVALATQKESLRGKLALQEQEAENLKQSLSLLEEKSKDEAEQKRKLQKEQEERLHKKEILQRQRETMYQEQVKFSLQLENLQKDLGEKEKLLEHLRAEILEKQDRYFEERTNYSEAASYVKALSLRLKEKEAEVLDLLREKDAFSLKKEEEDVLFSRLSKEKEESNEEYLKIEKDLETCRQFCKETEEERKNLLALSQNLQYRYQTLEQISKNYEGYQASVRSLLTYKQLPTQLKKEVLGTVAELFHVEKKYETALDVALGSLQQNIVVENQETAKECIALLKKEQMGRATFLPLQNLSYMPLEDHHLKKAKQCKGFLGMANEKVKTDEKYISLAEFLLGRCYVTDTLENAKELSKQFQNKVKIVTLEGDFIQAGGAMTGGSFKEKQGKLLSRKTQIQEILQQKDQAIQKEKNLRQQWTEAREKLDILLPAYQESLEKKKTIEALFLKKELERNHEKQKEHLLEEKLSKAKKEKDELEKETKQMEKQENDAFEKAEKIQGEIKETRDFLEQSETENKADIQKREQLRETLSDLRFSLQSMDEALQVHQEFLDRLKEETLHQVQKEEQDLLAKEKMQSSLQLLKQRQEDTQQALESYVLEEAANMKKLALLTEQKKAKEEEMKVLQERERALTKKCNQLENERQKEEAAQNTLLEKISEKRSDLWQKYSLTYEQCQQLLQNLSSQEISAWQKWFLETSVKDLPKLEKNIFLLSKQMEDLGPVHLGAIEASQTLQERYDFLSQQAQDLLLAKAELEKIIKDLTKKMQEIFLESFQKINAQFDQSFKALFGGGMASLELENGDNPLESNIEIRVSPPGKRLQSMLLLSGGEKALAAIALLFALLSLKPSPFVILDEIEAALDEANVHRFAHYIRHYAEKSQFILVTHRKGTMESCDRIYGVTMQEKGVSRILSLKLSSSQDEHLGKTQEEKTFLHSLK